MEVTLKFELEKETKGAVRYRETGEPGAVEIVGTIYLRKSGLPTPYPQELTITVKG